VWLKGEHVPVPLESRRVDGGLCLKMVCYFASLGVFMYQLGVIGSVRHGCGGCGCDCGAVWVCRCGGAIRGLGTTRHGSALLSASGR